jgi:pimeloyl-ACP methyl ester carboxylesterase
MERTVVVGGRVAACTWVDGAGVGAPVVLVHGHTGAKEDFAGVVQALAEDRSVIAVDLPGHGGSERPGDPSGYELGRLAEWLLAFVGVAGLGRFHLLGHSMGGLVAQRAAVAAPERLASLILMGSGLGALRAEALEFIGRVAAVARTEGAAAAFEEGMRSWAEAPVDEELKARRATDVDYLRRRYARLDPAAIWAGAEQLATAGPVADQIRLGVPVLVVHGEHDYAWEPPEQEALAAAIPGARRVSIPVSYHSPQKENPEAWLAAVRGFLRDADAVRAGAGTV